MKDRLIQMLQKEGLSRNDFATKLGVQRSNITHILDGRNKPSYDFIEKLLNAFPQINAEWLLLGTGKMYKGAVIGDLFSTEPAHVLPESDPKTANVEKKSTEKTNKVAPKTGKDVTISDDKVPNLDETKPKVNNLLQDEMTMPAPLLADALLGATKKEIERIVILYKDKSFDVYW